MRHPMLTAAAVIGFLALAGAGCAQAPAPSSPATPAAPTTPPASSDSSGLNGTPGAQLNVEPVQLR